MRDPLGPPPPARHPDTVFLFGLCLLASVSQLLSGTDPGSVEALVPPALALGWNVLLLAGTLTTLTGVFWRTRLTGVMLEAVGRVMFAPAALAYAIAVVAVAGWTGLLAALTFAGFAASSGWRIRQIMHAVGDVSSVLRIMSKARDQADRDGADR